MPSVESKLDWPKLLATALTAPGNVGNTYCRFYDYSWLNQMYLLYQGVLEPVATYKRWQSLGRQVLKGSKAKEIIRPIIIEKKGESGEVAEKKVLFKAVKCLFGYSETEGEELPVVEPAGWDIDRAHLALNIERVPFQSTDGNTMGYSYRREYAISPLAPYSVKTRFHEMAHIVIGHTAPDQMAEYQQHRGVYEFQAESTAYLVGHELEAIDETQASESRGYIQGWLQGETPPDTAIRSVFSATDKILRSGRMVIEATE